MSKRLPPLYLLLLLVPIVIIINLILFKDFWGYGFGVTENWTWLAYYASLKGNLLSKAFDIWKTFNLYQGTMIIYIGTIDRLFPSNYQMIYIISFVGKIIATILLFPAILTITNNKVLAFMGSIFFAVSYASTGSFLNTTNSMEYWGIGFLSLFSIFYTKVLNKQKLDYRYLILTNIFLFLAMQFIFIRLLGLVMVLIIAELLFIFLKKTIVKNAIIRSLIFIAMFFFFASGGYDGGSASAGGSQMAKNIIKYISDGNWFAFLHPLAGLSQTLIPARYAYLLLTPGSVINTNSIAVIIYKYILVALPTLFLISIILPVKTVRFFFISIVVNVFWLLLIYFFGINYTADARFYLFPQAVIASLILTISFASGIEWYMTGKKNSLLFVTFIAPLLAFFFIFVTWMVNFGKNSLIIYDPIDRYLPVPQLGISLFFAAIFTLVLTVIRSSHKRILLLLRYAILGLLLFFTIYTSFIETQFFGLRKSEGINLEIQKNIQSTLYHSYIKNKGDRVIYFVKPQANIIDQEQYMLLDTINSWPFTWWSYNNRIDSLGCIIPLIREWEQSVAIIVKDGEIFFKASARCPVKPDNKFAKLYYEDQIMTLPLDNMFAFTLNNGEITDMTKEIKEKLQQQAN